MLTSEQYYNHHLHQIYRVYTHTAFYIATGSLPVALYTVLKAIHARGGLLPASIHVFEAGWRKY